MQVSIGPACLHVAKFLGRRANLASLFRANSEFSLDDVRECQPHESAFPCPVVIFVVLALETNLAWERLQLMATGLPSPRDTPPTLLCIIYTQSCTLLTAGKIKPGIFRNMYTHKHILYITPCHLCSYVSVLVEQSCLLASVPLFCYAWLWKLTLVLGLYRCFVCIKSQGPQALWLGVAILQAIFFFLLSKSSLAFKRSCLQFNALCAIWCLVLSLRVLSCCVVLFFLFVLLALKQGCTF